MSASVAACVTRAVVAVCILSAPAFTQDAYCDCCGGLYRPAGSTWFGADRRYGGLCKKCTLQCLDCRRMAEQLRRLYNRLTAAQAEEGQTVAELHRRGQEIDRVRQRWADLRYACLASGQGDIGRLDPERRDSDPSQGIRSPQAKQQFRRQADALRDKAAQSLDPEVIEAMFVDDDLWREVARSMAGSSRETVRAAQLMDRLAKDPPDPEYEVEVQPRLVELPSAKGKPRLVELCRDANQALNNSNAYGEAYLVSFERYQGAERDGKAPAMLLQEGAMRRFAQLAEQEARQAELVSHEARMLWAQQLEERQAALAKDGKSGQERWIACQARLRAEGWPEEIRDDMTEAGASKEWMDACLQAALALTPDEAEKLRVARREELKAVDAMAMRLNSENVPAVWPEPLHLPALELLKFQAQMLHATATKRSVELPPENPFSEK